MLPRPGPARCGRAPVVGRAEAGPNHPALRQSSHRSPRGGPGAVRASTTASRPSPLRALRNSRWTTGSGPGPLRRGTAGGPKAGIFRRRGGAGDGAWNAGLYVVYVFVHFHKVEIKISRSPFWRKVRAGKSGAVLVKKPRFVAVARAAGRSWGPPVPRCACLSWAFVDDLRMCACESPVFPRVGATKREFLTTRAPRSA